MDDAYDSGFSINLPTYQWVAGWIEIVGCLLVALACVVLLRRRPLPALLAAVGALLAGASTALLLVSYDTGRWMLSDGFWQLVTYGRAIGFAVLGLALLLALLRSRRLVA